MPVVGTDLLIIERGGTPHKTTAQDIANLGGGGGVSGSDRAVQFNNNGAAGGADRVSIGTSGNLVLSSNTVQPNVPPADTLQIYARRRAGADWPEIQRPSGREIPLQPHFGLNRIATWAPSSGTSVAVSGMPRAIVGTASTPTIAASSFVNAIRRWRMTSATTANSVCDERSQQFLCFRGNATAPGGWTYTNRISLVTIPTNARGLFGLIGSTSALSTSLDPRAQTNMIAVGFDSAVDANLQVLHNSGSGAATAIDLGSDFPVNITNVYTIVIYAAPNDSSVWVRVTCENTGAFVDIEITTNLPTATQLLSVRNYMSNGGTAAACAYDCSGVYVETDL